MSFDNVVLFSAESLRYDFCPDLEGIKFRCVASSTQTGTSLSTMVTGLNPPRHMCFDFRTSIPGPIKTLFNLKGYNTYFITHAGSVVPRVLRKERIDPKELNDIEEPFVVVDEGYISHFPYRWDLRGQDEKFLKECLEGKRDIREEYQHGINGLIGRYRKTLETLKEKNLLGNTLVIFVGDHGQLLGEYGFYGHCKPIVPELVYVPLIFYNPSFESKEMGVLGRHADILPTILGELDIEWGEKLEGINLLDSFGYDEAKLVGYCGVNLFNRKYKADSVWAESGGYVEEVGRLDRGPKRAAPFNQKKRLVKGMRVEGEMNMDDARQWLKLFRKGKYQGIIRCF